MNDGCEHKWIYGGVKYEDEREHLSGTSARRRIYYDWFYCEKCLNKKFIRLLLWDETTYHEVKFNATPK